MPTKDLIGLVIAGALVVGAYVYQRSLKDYINELKYELATTQTELANRKLESTRLKNSLDKQTEKVRQLKASEKLNLAKLQKWKNKKPEVRYRHIETIRKVQSNECKDIKDTIDAVSNLDFKLL